MLKDLERTVALVVVHAKTRQGNVDAYEGKLVALAKRRGAADRGAEWMRRYFIGRQALGDPAGGARARPLAGTVQEATKLLKLAPLDVFDADPALSAKEFEKV